MAAEQRSTAAGSRPEMRAIVGRREIAGTAGIGGIEVAAESQTESRMGNRRLASIAVVAVVGRKCSGRMLAGRRIRNRNHLGPGIAFVGERCFGCRRM